MRDRKEIEAEADWDSRYRGFWKTFLEVLLDIRDILKKHDEEA
jgi:hypothetical protein